MSVKKKKATAKKSSKKSAVNLLVVESPTKTKTLKKFLGRNFKIMATKGHFLDLPKSKLGVEVENDFEPNYIYIRGKKKTIDEIAKQAKKSDKIYLAPDPDREGEAIAYHLYTKLNKFNDNIYRVVYNELTKQAVQKALKDAGSIDDNRVMAQQARRILDRLVGYKVSPILWKTVLRGLSAGRVQSVALKIICKREEEIDSFEPKEFWKVKGLFEADKKKQFNASLFKIDGEDFEISSEKDAKAVCKDIKKREYAVKSVKKENKKRNPLPPFITSTLQQDAAIRLRFAPQKTMYVAQQLYEGIELGDAGSVGLITYMRTDSVRVAEEALEYAREYISNQFGSDYLPDKPRRYKTKKSAQDAHEAIRPTALEYDPDDIKNYLTSDQYKLYNLIFSRFVASQMNPAIYETNTVDIEDSKYLFRVVSSKVQFDGFMRIYKLAKEKNNGNGNDEQKLPELKEGQKLNLLDLDATQHFTKPPPRYTEASLVKELEQNGIGRPSTYAQIISTLRNRKYVEMEKRALLPTDLGKTVNRILLDHFSDIFNVKYTAQMEEELDKIEEGKDNWVDVLKDFYEPLSKTLKNVESKLKDIRQSTQEVSDEKCEKCGSPMVIRFGRNGRFLACSNYPDCKSTKPLNGENGIEETDRDCPKCGNKLVIRQGRFGRFVACSTYPECDFTEAFSMGVKCSRKGCKGEFVEKRSRRGKLFYGCSEYPKCNEALWYKPVDKKCPSCGHYFMLEKNTKKDGLHYRCPECKFILKEEETAERLPNAVK